MLRHVAVRHGSVKSTSLREIHLGLDHYEGTRNTPAEFGGAPVSAGVARDTG
jgi:hypothetical protein